MTKTGHIVSESTFRLNMAKKEHKKHVRELLAQAIVHKTLDMERMRQVNIKKKLEEIAKIELVQRVQVSVLRCRQTSSIDRPSNVIAVVVVSSWYDGGTRRCDWDL